MKGISRGTAPHEFTLRVPCLTPAEFSLEPLGAPTTIMLLGMACEMVPVHGGLILTMRGFPTTPDAEEHFSKLQRVLISASFARSASISFSTRACHAQAALVRLFPGSIPAIEAGWPDNLEIAPLIIPTWETSIYPEDDYVMLDGVMRMHLNVSSSLESFTAELRAVPVPSAVPVPEEILLAAFAYTHAIRTTHSVWGFLQLCMALEMLAQFTGMNGGPTARFRNVIKTYCAPGIATTPLTSIYSSAQDCSDKADAIYDVRCKYMHDGRVTGAVVGGYTFSDIVRMACASLRHIVEQLL